jgi:hypothetical protein
LQTLSTRGKCLVTRIFSRRVATLNLLLGGDNIVPAKVGIVGDHPFRLLRPARGLGAAH